MSFGFSPGDILALISITQKAFNGWRSAGKRFEDISDTLNSFEILLSHVNHRFDELDHSLRGRRRELERVLRGCTSAVVELAEIAERHRRLRNWDKLKLGLKDISSPKERLVRHMGLLTPFLLMTEMESIGKDIRCIPSTFDRIPNIIQGAVTVAFGKLLDSRADDMHSTRSSVLTTYGDDDKRAYKELRRNLQSIGIKDSDIREHRRELIKMIKSVLSADNVPEDPTFDECTTGQTAMEAEQEQTNMAAAAALSTSRLQEVDCAKADPGSVSRAKQAYCESDAESDIADHGIGSGSIDGPLLEDAHPTNGPISIVDRHQSDSTDGESAPDSKIESGKSTPDILKLDELEHPSDLEVNIPLTRERLPEGWNASETHLRGCPAQTSQSRAHDSLEGPNGKSDVKVSMRRSNEAVGPSVAERSNESQSYDNTAFSDKDPNIATRENPHLHRRTHQANDSFDTDGMQEQPSHDSEALQKLRGTSPSSKLMSTPTHVNTDPLASQSLQQPLLQIPESVSDGEEFSNLEGASMNRELVLEDSDFVSGTKSGVEDVSNSLPDSTSRSSSRNMSDSKSVLTEASDGFDPGPQDADASSQFETSSHIESESESESELELNRTFTTRPSDLSSLKMKLDATAMTTNDPSAPTGPQVDPCPTSTGPSQDPLQDNSTSEAISDIPDGSDAQALIRVESREGLLAEAYDHHQTVEHCSRPFSEFATVRPSSPRSGVTNHSRSFRERNRQSIPYPRIEYKPLDPNVEHRLTVQLLLVDELPAPSVDFMKDRRLIETAVSSFRCHFHGKADAGDENRTCQHGFPSASNFAYPPVLTPENLQGKCDCRVIEWKSTDTDVLDELRGLVRGVSRPNIPNHHPDLGSRGKRSRRKYRSSGSTIHGGMAEAPDSDSAEFDHDDRRHDSWGSSTLNYLKLPLSSDSDASDCSGSDRAQFDPGDQRRDSWVSSLSGYSESLPSDSEATDSSGSNQAQYDPNDQRRGSWISSLPNYSVSPPPSDSKLTDVAGPNKLEHGPASHKRGTWTSGLPNDLRTTPHHQRPAQSSTWSTAADAGDCDTTYLDDCNTIRSYNSFRKHGPMSDRRVIINGDEDPTIRVSHTFQPMYSNNQQSMSSSHSPPDYEALTPGTSGAYGYHAFDRPPMNPFTPNYPQMPPIPPAPRMKPRTPILPPSSQRGPPANMPGRSAFPRYTDHEADPQHFAERPTYEQATRPKSRSENASVRNVFSRQYQWPRASGWTDDKPGDHNPQTFRDPIDTFAEFMARRAPPTREAIIIEKPLGVSLEDIFNGTSKKLKVQREIEDPQTGRQSIEDKILSVPIKRGLKAGSKIKYPGMGDSIRGEIQDLHFIVGEKSHPLFVREGDDLRHTIEITLDEAQNGWRRDVPTIDGKMIRVSKSGPTGSTFEERFPGLGMPKSRNPEARGDYIVGLRIVV